MSLDFLKVARLLLFEWTWRERLLSLAARQIYRRNFPPVALSNQNQRYESTRQSSQIITRSRAKLFEHTINTSSLIAIVISVNDQELLNSSHWLHVHLTTQFVYGLQKAKYRDVREHQRKVIESHCCGKDVFLSAPTGWSGKKAWPLRWPHSFSIFYVTAKEKRLCPFAWFRLNGHCGLYWPSYMLHF